MSSTISPLEANTKWLAFSVFLPLLPVAFIAMSRSLFTSDTRLKEFLKDGQLLFYSTTLTATAAGDLLWTGIAGKPGCVLLAVANLFVLLMSAMLFAGTSVLYIKGMSTQIQSKLFYRYSIVFVVSAIVLSNMALNVGLG